MWVPVGLTSKVSDDWIKYGVQSLSTQKIDWYLGLMIRAIIKSRRYKLKLIRSLKKDVNIN